MSPFESIDARIMREWLERGVQSRNGREFLESKRAPFSQSTIKQEARQSLSKEGREQSAERGRGAATAALERRDRQQRDVMAPFFNPRCGGDSSKGRYG